MRLYRSAATAIPATPAMTTCAAPRADPAFLEIGLAEGEAEPVALPVVKDVVGAPVAVGKEVVVELRP